MRTFDIRTSGNRGLALLSDERAAAPRANEWGLQIVTLPQLARLAAEVKRPGSTEQLDLAILRARRQSFLRLAMRDDYAAGAACSI